MSLKSNYQKLKKHLKTGGGFYSFWRGFRYFIFLIKKNFLIIKNFRIINSFLGIRSKGRNKQLSRPGITCGRTRIMPTTYGVKLFWQDKEITERVGLNTAINTCGIWTDSSKADWEIQEAGQNYFVLRFCFKDLPLIQRWIIRFKSEAKILWEIEMEVEEDLKIDQRRTLIFVSAEYKSWLSSYEQGDFPRMGNWQEINLNNRFSRSVGVRFAKEKSLPALFFEFKKNGYGQINPFIQNVPKEVDAHLIGAEIVDGSEKKYFLPGRYKFFSGELTLFESDRILDTKIEEFRRQHFQNIRSNKLSEERKLRVLLVNMPWEKEGHWGVRAGSRWPHIKDKSEGSYLPFPFFLAYAGSLLKEDGVEVRLVDALAEKIQEREFLNRVNEFQPDLLVAEISTVSLEDDLKLLKKLPKEISIVICGPDINIRKPEFLEQHRYINYVLVGEYEWTLLDLVQHLSRDKDLKDVPGLIYREKEEIKVNSSRPLINLDALPWPLREELPMGNYWDLPGNIPFPSVQMLASRGCPYRCIFCLWPQVMYQGNYYRARDPIRVADEMEYLVKIMGFKSVYFDDDTWNLGRERILKFCNEVKNRNLENIPWAIMARPDLMDEELLKNLKISGLWSVKYGVESGVQELVDNANKNMDLKKARRMIEFTKELGIKTHLTFTFGLPGETKETIARTIDYALNLNPDSIQFSIVTPVPGTDYYRMLDEKGLIVSKCWSDYDGNYKSVMKLNSLNSQDLEKAKRKAYVLWGEEQRKKRGFSGDIKRFRKYAEERGIHFALNKTLDYARFVLLKRDSYLNEKL